MRPCVVCIVRYTQFLMWKSHENDDCDDDDHDHECMHMSEHNTYVYNMCCAHSCTRMCTLFHMPTSRHIPQLPLRHGNWRQGRIGTKRPRRADAPPFSCPHTKKEASLAATAVVVTCVVNQLGQQNHAQTQTPKEIDHYREHRLEQGPETSGLPLRRVCERALSEVKASHG